MQLNDYLTMKLQIHHRKKKHESKIMLIEQAGNAHENSREKKETELINHESEEVTGALM
jgi:hypothetical protein